MCPPHKELQLKSVRIEYTDFGHKIGLGGVPAVADEERVLCGIGGTRAVQSGVTVFPILWKY